MYLIFKIATNRINDYQIETLAENIINKVHSIYNYYYNLLKNEKNSLEKIKFHKFSKEINTFILITVNQSRTFRNNIIKKNKIEIINWLIESPSKPSVKLKAFEAPIITNIANGKNI